VNAACGDETEQKAPPGRSAIDDAHASGEQEGTVNWSDHGADHVVPRVDGRSLVGQEFDEQEQADDDENGSRRKLVLWGRDVEPAESDQHDDGDQRNVGIQPSGKTEPEAGEQGGGVVHTQRLGGQGGCGSWP